MRDEIARDILRWLEIARYIESQIYIARDSKLQMTGKRDEIARDSQRLQARDSKRQLEIARDSQIRDFSNLITDGLTHGLTDIGTCQM